MRHLFVINPAAGNFDRTREITGKIQEIMGARGCGEYEIFRSDAPCSAVGRIKSAYERWGALRVYACGGDGTLNECVTGAAGLPGVAVTHYPCGTGNDFIRIFGGNSVSFYDLNELIDGETIKIDTIKCNDRYSVNILSMGLDARIASDMQKFKRLPAFSKSAYNLSVVYNLFKGITRRYSIDIDGTQYEGRFTLIAACNGSHYGGGFNPMPDARLNDGLIDFLLVRPVSVLKAAAAISKYAEGKYKELPELIIPHRGRRFKITCYDDSELNTDGEISMVREAVCEVQPQSLELIVPKCVMADLQSEKQREISR